MVLDLVRSSLHRVISTKAGDGLAPIRVQKDLARRVNTLLGEPLCSKDELARRRAGRARLEELKRSPRGAAGTEGASGQANDAERAVAPVVVYFEKDRNARLLGRIRETFEARGVAFTEADVTGDEVTKDFVMREARCKEDELPIVFVAGAAVGGYNELVEWDVSGKLAKALRGEDVRRA
jgi:hypothetical protein